MSKYGWKYNKMPEILAHALGMKTDMKILDRHTPLQIKYGY